MSSVVSAIKNTISISSFNKGLAGKIFRDVRDTGTKVVMKNNLPECVLMSPEEYVSLMEELTDAKLLAISLARLEHNDSNNDITQDELMEKLGISQTEIDAMDEVEFE